MQPPCHRLRRELIISCRAELLWANASTAKQVFTAPLSTLGRAVSYLTFCVSVRTALTLTLCTSNTLEIPSCSCSFENLMSSNLHHSSYLWFFPNTSSYEFKTLYYSFTIHPPVISGVFPHPNTIPFVFTSHHWCGVQLFEVFL